MELFLSLCLLLCGIYDHGDPRRQSVCQESKCCVDGSGIYSDPHSHTVELLDYCCHTSLALLWLGVRCVHLGFKLRNSCSGNVLFQGIPDFDFSCMCAESYADF